MIWVCTVPQKDEIVVLLSTLMRIPWESFDRSLCKHPRCAMDPTPRTLPIDIHGDSHDTHEDVDSSDCAERLENT